MERWGAAIEAGEAAAEARRVLERGTVAEGGDGAVGDAGDVSRLRPEDGGLVRRRMLGTGWVAEGVGCTGLVLDRAERRRGHRVKR